MLNERNKSLCWRVLAKYGCEHQLNMVIEECSELREELVDVVVVCQQMFLALKMDEEDINKRAGSKLERALQ